MPSLMLRGLPADLLRRLRAYADRKGLGQREAAIAWLEAGERALDDREARAARLRARHEASTPAERAAGARHAALVRHQGRRDE